MGKFKGKDTVEADEFVNNMISNSYWREAGPLVVKELIFLDCLYHYYRDKQQLLNDDDYEELKEHSQGGQCCDHDDGQRGSLRHGSGQL